jgi:hypothetical protein
MQRGPEPGPISEKRRPCLPYWERSPSNYLFFVTSGIAGNDTLAIDLRKRLGRPSVKRERQGPPLSFVDAEVTGIAASFSVSVHRVILARTSTKPPN